MSKTTKKSPNLTESREQIMEDIEKLIADAQDLVKEAKTASGVAIDQKVQAARDALYEGVDNLKKHGEEACERTIDYSKGIDEFVRENPWRFIGFAALGGFVFRMLLHRD